MTRIRVKLFGLVKAELPGAKVDFLPDKRYQFLAYLAASTQWVSRDQLAYLFWPDVLSKTARHSLRQLLKRVRALSWLEELEVERERIRWLVNTDCQQFRDALDTRDLALAFESHTGSFLSGLEDAESSEFASWLLYEREHLRNRWRAAAMQYAATLEPQGAMSILAKLLEADSLDEEVLQLYMQAAAKSGHFSLALTQYHFMKKILKEEMDLELSSLTHHLKQQIELKHYRVVEADVQSLSVAESKLSLSLPKAVTTFVGRDDELKRIREYLLKPECNLLTLLGPGGIGKSRIALKATHDLKERFSDSYFIALESMNHIEHLPEVFAKGLGITLIGSTAAFDQVIKTVADNSILLVLDNFEKHLEGVRSVSDLLAACPNLKIMVTSRQRLNLAEEWLLPLEGLAFPQHSLPCKKALTYSAIQLFVDRAKRIKPQFELDDDNVYAVGKIVSLLQGVPLAIELAAARVGLMSSAHIATEIEKSLDVLSTSARNIASRHRSLRATFEYSWQRLSFAEQEDLKKLSVFQGGFRREAVKLVTGTSTSVLVSLLEKSLLRVTPPDRYERHPLIHQYSQEKLFEFPDIHADVLDKHAAYYLRLIRRWDATLRGQKSTSLTVANLAEDWQNIRSAWLHCSQANRHNEIVMSALALRNACLSLVKYQEAVELFAKARNFLRVSPIEQTQRGLGLCLVCEAWFHFRVGNFEIAMDFANKGLTHLTPLKETQGILIGINTLGSVAYRMGRYDKAQFRWQKGLAMAERIRDQEHVLAFASNLGAAAEHKGDFGQAQRYYEQALVLARQLGNKTRLCSALNNLGALLVQLGVNNKAEALLDEGLKLAKALGFQQRVYVLLSNLTQIALSQENYNQARSYAHEALELARKASDKAHESSVLDLLANIALGEHDGDKAKSYLLEGLSIAWEKQALSEVMQLMTSLAKFMKDAEPEQAAILLCFVVNQSSATQQNHLLAQALLRQLTLPRSAKKIAQDRANDFDLAVLVERLLTTDDISVNAKLHH